MLPYIKIYEKFQKFIKILNIDLIIFQNNISIIDINLYTNQ